MENNKDIKVNKSPLDMFFALGDKVTKGDPKRKADFDYYMLWVIFLAFFGIFFGNIRNFFLTYQFQFLGWSLFGLAIMWFQFYNLKNMFQMRKAIKNEVKTDTPVKEEVVESVEDMLSDFNNEDKKSEDKNTQDEVGNSKQDRK